jgi:hypothetical protein
MVLKSKKGEKMKNSAKVIIEGTKPLLFNTFRHDALDSKKAKKGSTGNNNEEWEATVLMDEKRRLYLLDTYFLGSIRGGGKYIKVGKGNLSKNMASTLEISGSKLYLIDRVVPEPKDLLQLETEKVYLDIRGVVNPMTKGRNLRYRVACSPGWQCEFIVSWDDYVISKENMKMCLENAGTYVGVGDGRSIGFGRFKINDFKMLD